MRKWRSGARRTLRAGPTCHTGAHTCYYSQVDGDKGAAFVPGGGSFGQEEAEPHTWDPLVSCHLSLFVTVSSPFCQLKLHPTHPSKGAQVEPKGGLG